MPPTPPTSPSGARSPARSSARGRVLPLVPGLHRPPTRGRPLPDAAAVRLAVVPDSAPPYDDERVAAGLDQHTAADRSAPRAPRRLGLVTVPRAVDPGSPAAASAAPRREPLPPGEAPRPGKPLPPGEAPRPGKPLPPGHTLPGGVPGPGQGRRAQAPGSEWPGQFAQVLAETLAGSRPEGQILPWTTDQARRRIRRLGPMLTAGVQPRVRRVVTSRPAADVVEMTVVVGFGPRIRALAVRLERDAPRQAGPGRPARAARWVCTVIEAA